MRSEGEGNSNFSGSLSRILGKKRIPKNNGTLKAFRYPYKEEKLTQNSGLNSSISIRGL